MFNSEQLHFFILGMALRQSWKALLHFKCRWHDARKPQRGMDRAEPGAFLFGSSWGINFLPYFPFFLDEYTESLSKTVVSDLYGCGFAFAARAEHLS